MPGVDVAADAEQLPFRTGTLPARGMRCRAGACARPQPGGRRTCAACSRPGGYLHLVTPFCHPFHEYPRDYRRFTPDGLKLLVPGLEVVAEGWRTGPTATLLVFALEYVQAACCPGGGGAPGRTLRSGGLLFPLRYLDLRLLRATRARGTDRQSLLSVGLEAGRPLSKSPPRGAGRRCGW